jgi:hypothetical protein
VLKYGRRTPVATIAAHVTYGALVWRVISLTG